MKKNLLICSFIVMLLSITIVSAFEFDNVKAYNTETKTATITNAFGLGGEITTAKLDTPQIYQVMVGKNITLMEFTINPYTDYPNILGSLEFINLNKGGEKFEKQTYIQYLGLEDYEVNDTKINCSLNKSGNLTCIEEVIGKHTEQKYNWINWDKNAYENKEVKIRIIGDVGIEETVDIIPTIAGRKIDEWAIYTSGNLTTIDGSYTVVKYINAGTFNTTETINASILIVSGGGGGGGGDAGAGGGAGGLIYNNSYNISGNNTITIGTGGAGGLATALNNSHGSNGTNSSFGTISAYGGGGGDGYTALGGYNGEVVEVQIIILK